MAGLDPAIQELPAANAILDRRVKPGDDKEGCNMGQIWGSGMIWGIHSGLEV